MTQRLAAPRIFDAFFISEEKAGKPASGIDRVIEASGYLTDRKNASAHTARCARRV
jgi:glyceraldehyde-3-phosphate dehydrogenase/erythrose-4-phosphate dehydrogenase